MIAKDKQLHLIAGGFVGLVFSVAAYMVGIQHPAIYGIFMASVAGLGKEYYDSKHPEKHTVDPKDVAYTLYGGIISSVIVDAFVNVNHVLQ